LPSSIAQVQGELKGKGLVVLAVSFEESPAKVAAWVKKVGLPFPVFLDEDGTVRRAWKVTVTPTVFLLDRQGRLVGKTVGTRPWTSPAGRALFAALLAS
jgi:peroxiredoxin